MFTRHTGRLLGSLALLSGVTLADALPSAVGAAPPAPKLVVTPAAPMRSGETVTVSGHGFKPGESVYIVECLASAKSSLGCDLTTATPATISATGVLPKTKFKVVAGQIGSSSCGVSKATLKNCAISAGNASGGDTAVARITFIVPKAKK